MGSVVPSLFGDCPNCNAGHDLATVIDDYLFNVEWDRNVLPCQRLLQCQTCNVVYADPMPDEAALVSYYSDIYRAVGRPHHFSGQPKILYRHFAYLSYITTFVSVAEINRVYEIGAGFGEMGSLLKFVNPEIELLTHEPDLHTRDHLERAGYTVLPQETMIEGDIDLVISIHSMEHFTSLQHFFSLSNNLKSGGHFFVEVPNCTIEDGWLKRPYDSPHLIFFDPVTIRDSFERRQYKTIAISKSGVSLQEDFKLCAAWKKQFETWNPMGNYEKYQHAVTPRQLAKRLLPSRAKQVIRAAIRPEAENEPVFGAFDINNSAPQGWLLRGLFQKL